MRRQCENSRLYIQCFGNVLEGIALLEERSLQPMGCERKGTRLQAGSKDGSGVRGGRSLCTWQLVRTGARSLHLLSLCSALLCPGPVGDWSPFCPSTPPPPPMAPAPTPGNSVASVATTTGTVAMTTGSQMAARRRTWRSWATAGRQRIRTRSEGIPTPTPTVCLPAPSPF